MLDNQNNDPPLLDRVLDTFFHLPTLLMMALLIVIVQWQIYDIGVDFDREFIRLNSNQGNMTLLWTNGCCAIDW